MTVVERYQCLWLLNVVGRLYTHRGIEEHCQLLAACHILL